MKRFFKWFLSQAGREDPIGDVARDVVSDISATGKSVEAVMKIRYGGASRKFLTEDFHMELALEEFDRRKKEGTLYSFRRGDASKEIEVARHLVAVVLHHGLESGALNLPKKGLSSGQVFQFNFTALDGTECAASVRVSGHQEYVVTAWFGVDGSTLPDLRSLRTFELLNHCHAMVQMYAEYEDFIGVGSLETPERWAYDLNDIEKLKRLVSLYKGKFEYKQYRGGVRIIVNSDGSSDNLW